MCRRSEETTIETEFRPDHSIHQFMEDLFDLFHEAGDLTFPWD